MVAQDQESEKMILSTPAEVYAELHRQSSPTIRYYRQDLEQYDREIVESDKVAGVPFLHWTDECSTQLRMLYNHDADLWPAKGETIPFVFGRAGREEIVRQIVATADYLGDPMHYSSRGGREARYFDGQRLNDISLAEAGHIAREYEKKILSDWQK